MQIYALISWCFALCHAVTPPPIEWTKGYTNGQCESHNHAGVQTKDGGFLIVGDGQCYNTKENFKRQITIAKVDRKGNEQWMTNVGTVGFNYGKFGLELDDGTFLIAGSLSVGTKLKYIEKRLLVRVSAQGKVLHTQTFDNAGGLDGFMGLALAGPNVVVATGYVRGVKGYPDQPMFLIQGGYAMLMKFTYSRNTTQDLKVVFERVFNTRNATSHFTAYQGMRVVADDDGYTFSAASYINGGDTNFGLVQTDINGNLKKMSYHVPKDGYGSHPYAFTAASDSGYVIAGLGIRTVDDVPEGRILKLSRDGDVVFDTHFRHELTNYSTECYGVSICPDGGYIVACGTGPLYDQSSEPWQNLVQRVDSKGNSVWKKIYTGEHGRNGTGEYVVTDDMYGGYAIYMDTMDWGEGQTGGNFAIMHLHGDTD